MKAMLLAAGLGTRLRPLTDNLPKCMVPVAGTPVLEHNIRWLRSQGVVDLVVNLHYFPEAVTDYCGAGGRFGVQIQYSHEDELLGTAGALGAARRYFEGEERFLVVYADNLIQCKLARLRRFHQQRRAALSMALFWRADVSASGVVNLAEDERVVFFQEKPPPGAVSSHWVNAGLLLCEADVLNLIPAERYSDFGHDLLPAMLSSGMPMYGYRMGKDEALYWIDTLADWERTNRQMEESKR